MRPQRVEIVAAEGNGRDFLERANDFDVIRSILEWASILLSSS